MGNKDGDVPFGVMFTNEGGCGQYGGISIREYIATHIFAGLAVMAIPGTHNQTDRQIQELPGKAVALADALIEALNGRREETDK
jgi:hypothetical protein